MSRFAIYDVQYEQGRGCLSLSLHDVHMYARTYM